MANRTRPRTIAAEPLFPAAPKMIYVTTEALTRGIERLEVRETFGRRHFVRRAGDMHDSEVCSVDAHETLDDARPRLREKVERRLLELDAEKARLMRLAAENGVEVDGE